MSTVTIAVTTTPTRRPRARKPKPAITVLHDVNATPIIQAAQIAFAVMAAAKKDSWADAISTEGLPSLVRLTPEQQEILETHRQVLPNLRRRSPVISVEACPACGRWGWSASPVQKKCSWTLGCAGAPVKAAATAWKPPSLVELIDEDAPEDEPMEMLAMFEIEMVL